MCVTPVGFVGPKRLLPERHHCIFSGERGHEVWTDMEVAGVAVEREGKEGVGRERQTERERKCEIEQLFSIAQLTCLPSHHHLMFVLAASAAEARTHTQRLTNTHQNTPPAWAAEQPHRRS